MSEILISNVACVFEIIHDTACTSDNSALVNSKNIPATMLSIVNIHFMYELIHLSSHFTGEAFELPIIGERNVDLFLL